MNLKVFCCNISSNCYAINNYCNYHNNNNNNNRPINICMHVAVCEGAGEKKCLRKVFFVLNKFAIASAAAAIGFASAFASASAAAFAFVFAAAFAFALTTSRASRTKMAAPAQEPF